MLSGCPADTTRRLNCPGKRSTPGRSRRSCASIYKPSITLCRGVRPFLSKGAIDLIVWRRVVFRRSTSMALGGPGTGRSITVALETERGMTASGKGFVKIFAHFREAGTSDSDARLIGISEELGEVGGAAPLR